MIKLLAQPGDVVACEAPAYYATLEILGDRGIRVLPIPVCDSYGVDLDLLSTLFEQFRPRLFGKTGFCEDCTYPFAYCPVCTFGNSILFWSVGSGFFVIDPVFLA